jgi:hypothetical protein
VREQAAAALLSARDSGQGWQELHRVAAGFDLEVKPRGAGLVVTHRTDRRLRVRASAVDRGLAMQAMTAALGPYEPPGKAAETEQAKTSYARPGRTGPLYEAFERERAAAMAARETALAALREQHRTHARELSAWYRERLREEKVIGPRGALRPEGFRHIIEMRAEDRARRIKREAQERRQVRAQHPIPSWQGFLETQAAQGNEEALAVLRSRQQRAAQLHADILTADDVAKARHILHQHMRPEIRRDGRVVYRVADGGMVSDEARQVRVVQATTAATFLALNLAADRFGYRPLAVAGTDAFRREIAELAGQKGLRVVFADQQLERERISAAARDRGRVDPAQEHGR